MIKNKILIFIFIFFFIITKNHNSKAGILDFFTSDPWFSGCVYDPFGNKIGCSQYNYNEAKNPGSKRIAENNCLMELKKIQKNSKFKDTLIVGCTDSAGPHPR
jgi:hypothetical protein